MVLFMILIGCQKPSVDTASVSKSGVDVIVEDGGQFPEFLVGTWRAEDAGWEFVFEPDGTISSAVIDNGMVRVNPSDGVATIELQDNGIGTYKLGRWSVNYSASNRELIVKVIVDEYHLDMLTYGLKGSSEDFFVGYITNDNSLWYATWYTFPEIITLTPEPTKLPVDPNDQARDIVFKKQ